MTRQAIILAGGKGTRLAARLNGRPKPLVDVLGVPLLQRQIEALRDAGFDSVVILVNHEAEQIRAFCADHDNWGMDLRLIDDGEPRGTAGAVFDALDSLADQIVVVYGDTLFDVDFARFLGFHAAAPDTVASLFLHPNDHPQDSDLVELDADHRISKFHAYPHPDGVWLPNMVNAALYVIDRPALAAASAAFAADRGIIDFAKHVFPWMLTAGFALGGYVSSEYIKDIGTPDRLDRACAALAAGKVAAASLRVPQTAVFLDRDGTLNRANGHVSDPAQLELFDFAAAAVKALNKADLRAVLVTNQPVIARGDTDFAGLAAIHAKMETLLGREGALLDRIYFCPHHTDRGFAGEVPELKFDCDCRKPKPGMLLAAAADMNIDLARSWMIGDSAADIRAGAAAAVTTIRVATGEPPRPTDPAADFACADVRDAVGWITGGFADWERLLAARIDAAGADAPVAVIAADAAVRDRVAALVTVVLRRRATPRRIVTAATTADITAKMAGFADATTVDVDRDAAVQHLLAQRPIGADGAITIGGGTDTGSDRSVAQDATDQQGSNR